LHGEADVEAELGDCGQARVLILQAAERVVKRQDALGVGGVVGGVGTREGRRLVEIDAVLGRPAALLAVRGAGVVDEPPPHGLDGGGVEVGPVGPRDLARADELEIRLVDEGRGGERVARPAEAFGVHLKLGGGAELFVDGRQEPVWRGGVARGGVGE